MNNIIVLKNHLQGAFILKTLYVFAVARTEKRRHATNSLWEGNKEGSQAQLCSETLAETIESGPLCITDLFQNKSVAYF